MNIAQASTAEFTKHANALLRQALRISIDSSGDQVSVLLALRWQQMVDSARH